MLQAKSGDPRVHRGRRVDSPDDTATGQQPTDSPDSKIPQENITSEMPSGHRELPPPILLRRSLKKMRTRPWMAQPSSIPIRSGRRPVLSFAPPRHDSKLTVALPIEPSNVKGESTEALLGASGSADLCLGGVVPSGSSTPPAPRETTSRGTQTSEPVLENFSLAATCSDVKSDLSDSASSDETVPPRDESDAETSSLVDGVAWQLLREHGVTSAESDSSTPLPRARHIHDTSRVMLSELQHTVLPRNQGQSERIINLSIRTRSPGMGEVHPHAGPSTSVVSSNHPIQNPQRPGQKRRHRQETGGGDSDDEEEEESHGRQPKVRRQGAPKLLLACPFWKLDPVKHMTCVNKQLNTVSRVKQHLGRVHYNPLYCELCFTVFPDKIVHETHIRSQSCTVSACSFSLLTHTQRNDLRSRTNSKLSEPDQWFAIWDYLFPVCPRPPSPYMDLSDDARHLFGFMLARIPTTIAAEVRAAGLNPGNLGTLQQDVTSILERLISRGVASLLESWVTERSSLSSVSSTSHVPASGLSSSSNGRPNSETSHPTNEEAPKASSRAVADSEGLPHDTQRAEPIVFSQPLEPREQSPSINLWTREFNPVDEGSSMQDAWSFPWDHHNRPADWDQFMNDLVENVD